MIGIRSVDLDTLRENWHNFMIKKKPKNHSKFLQLLIMKIIILILSSE